MSGYDVGDVARVHTVVRDENDALTNATLVGTIKAPDGTETVGTVVNDTTGKYHMDFAITAAGVWQWRFAATGAVVETAYGSLVATVPWSEPTPWVPSLREIGTYVPTRTKPVDVPGPQAPKGTFDSTTVPNDEAVTQLAQAAGAWVRTRAGDVDASLYDMARSVAAIRAAAFVELAYPQRDADVNVYEALFEQAELAVVALVEANQAAGENPPGEGLLPVYEFPEPVFDSDCYFI